MQGIILKAVLLALFILQRLHAPESIIVKMQPMPCRIASGYHLPTTVTAQQNMALSGIRYSH
ncbi:hypothetical protein NFF84_18150 [Proteus mirabilis]|uniref:hypothetical protein n=1 Tax=Proteus mirabilis TaxID=584 RepID=UPI0023F86B53|nr:hypothetical protein [Proteus mirabilis]MDF7138797.1 hypothetical protein [Proteus mirabilis]